MSSLPQDAMARVIRRTIADCIPFVVHVEITGRCNLRCRHCYLPANENQPDELSVDEWRQAFVHLKEQGSLFVAISGGEPMMRDDCLAILAAVREAGLALRLLTNGTLVDEARAGAIATLHPAAVEVSLLGGTAATHDSITTVSGSFDDAVAAVRRLVAAGVRTVLKVPIMRANWREFSRIEALAEQLATAVRYDVCISPRVDGDSVPLRERLADDELAAFLHERGVGPFSGPLPTVADEAVPCGAGQNGFSIAPDGTVYPCTALRIPLGNILHDGWAAIRQHPALIKLRQLRFGDLDHCGRCELAAMCGRCPGVALLETGRYDGPSPSACQLGAVLKGILKP